MPVTFGSNISSLRAQSNLNESTKAFQSSALKLSSGLRINSAVDDPAGLSVKSSLDLSSRVYTQGIRNVNDGISTINVVEGALNELSNITARQQELAEQAANGALSLSQRQALNTEANALVSEFNRIAQSTVFNGINLLDKTTTSIGIQAGFGTGGSVSFAIGDELDRAIGIGTFTSGTSVSVSSAYFTYSGDFNNDGKADLFGVDSGLRFEISLGNGDGTFKTGVVYATSAIPSSPSVADFNNDGNQDIIFSAGGVWLGNGDGSFRAPSAATGSGKTAVGDFNGDGKMDAVIADTSSSTVTVLTGNGDGTFSQSTITGAGTGVGVTVGDFNGDGRADIAQSDSSNVSIFLGTGTGTFATRITYSGGGSAIAEIAAADLNNDGTDDLVLNATGASSFRVMLSNSNGSFRAGTNYGSGNTVVSFKVGDLNGDGYVDFAGATSTSYFVFSGNGDGTFKSTITAALGANNQSLALADFTSDGVLDIGINDFTGTSTRLVLQNTRQVNTIGAVNIASRSGALSALSTFSATATRIALEQGSIGASRSRLTTTLAIVDATRVNLDSASSRIGDVDVAAESALFVSAKIRQDAVTAILAQANQAPAIALKLLGGG